MTAFLDLDLDPADAAAAEQLRLLTRLGAPSITLPPETARTVLTAARRRRRTRRVIGTVAGVSLSGAAALTLAAAYQPGHSPWFTITEPSPAMSPTIRMGQDVIFNKTRTPERGDVVRVRLTNDGDTFETILRVVALPGDRVACPAGDAGACTEITVNGTPFPQPYAVGTLPAWQTRHVPAGDVYLLGDNRPQAIDSRTVGPVPLTESVNLVEAPSRGIY